jgi:hypothetical protein
MQSQDKVTTIEMDEEPENPKRRTKKSTNKK